MQVSLYLGSLLPSRLFCINHILCTRCQKLFQTACLHLYKVLLPLKLLCQTPSLSQAVCKEHLGHKCHRTIKLHLPKYSFSALSAIEISHIPSLSIKLIANLVKALKFIKSMTLTIYQPNSWIPAVKAPQPKQDFSTASSTTSPRSQVSTSLPKTSISKCI